MAIVAAAIEKGRAPEVEACHVIEKIEINGLPRGGRVDLRDVSICARDCVQTQRKENDEVSDGVTQLSGESEHRTEVIGAQLAERVPCIR